MWFNYLFSFLYFVSCISFLYFFYFSCFSRNIVVVCFIFVSHLTYFDFSQKSLPVSKSAPFFFLFLFLFSFSPLVILLHSLSLLVFFPLPCLFTLLPSCLLPFPLSAVFFISCLSYYILSYSISSIPLLRFSHSSSSFLPVYSPISCFLHLIILFLPLILVISPCLFLLSFLLHHLSHSFPFFLLSFSCMLYFILFSLTLNSCLLSLPLPSSHIPAFL